MNYKKCPKCNLNYIPDNEEFCEPCKQLSKATSDTRTQRLTSPQKSVKTDFSHIVGGCIYGTNTRTIYEKFCDTLGWDKNKANQFGWQTPLYATNADTDRTRDVWFIYYPNYDVQRFDNVVKDCHAVNLIKNNGDTIIEVVEDSIGKSNNADRLTFVKTKHGYEFLGIYHLTNNGTTRIYQRISRDYPIK